MAEVQQIDKKAEREKEATEFCWSAQNAARLLKSRGAENLLAENHLFGHYGMLHLLVRAAALRAQKAA